MWPVDIYTASSINAVVLYRKNCFKSKNTKLKKIKFKVNDKNVGVMTSVYSKLTTETPKKKTFCYSIAQINFSLKSSTCLN